MIANFTVTGVNDQVAARLLDVDPTTDTQRLLARGLWRPEVGSEAVRQVFQLHPQAYKVEPGHVLKLELLPDDALYGMANPTSPDAAAQHPIIVKNLMLRLPGSNSLARSAAWSRSPRPSSCRGATSSRSISPSGRWDTEC